MDHAKFKGSYTKMNGSWRSPNDSASSLNDSWNMEESKIETNKAAEGTPSWLSRESKMARIDDWVGGYSPAYIHSYRQGRKKTIEIEGYNKTPKKN